MNDMRRSTQSRRRLGTATHVARGAALACAASLVACSLLDWQGLERGDADAAPNVDGSADAAAADAGNTLTVRCGPSKLSCPLSTAECCGTNGDAYYGAPMADYECVASDLGACASGVPIACARGADCAGPGDASDMVCCADETSYGGIATKVSCRQRASCTKSSIRIVVCDPSASDCPDAQACVPGSYNFGDYYVCQ